MPDGERFRDEKGYIRYDLIEQEDDFQQAIARLLKGVTMDRIALMCAEEPPARCHRSRLLGRVLTNHGVKVLHIRGDGKVQTHQEVFEEITGGQMSLFDQGEAPYLRSSKPHHEGKTIEQDEDKEEPPTYENH